jgi:hypothetical protein
MRYVSCQLLILLLVAAAPYPHVENISQQEHADLTLKFLQNRRAYNREKRYTDDTQYLRFLSMHNYANDPFIDTAEGAQAFWTNNLHNVSTVSLPKSVPGTDRTLWWIDLRDYGWNAAAFSAVARREPYFVEPNIDSVTAIKLRAFAGIDQDPKTNHVEVIVRADWFFRETAESDRSPSYYDLLFAPQRFRRVLKSQKRSKNLVRLGRNLVFKFKNFPANEKDFEKFYGIDKFDDFVKKSKIDPRHGAVVDGQENNASIVARQNRLLERKQGPIGFYYKTYDVAETSGQSDFIETLQKNFKFQAGENLAQTPVGGMATLLVDNKGTRLETADNRFATDNSDLRFDSRVRTGVSCFICHEKGIIAPKNLVKELLDAGIKLNIKKKEDYLATKGFFLDWEHKLEADQVAFVRLISRTSGFTPAKNALSLKQWRDKYDRPVSAETGAREFGMSVIDFKLLAAKSTRGRAAMLVHGKTIPRKTWEKDVFPELARIKVARRYRR